MSSSNAFPTHPGQVLREQFLEPLQLSTAALGRAIGVKRVSLEAIIHRQYRLDAHLANKLARYFSTEATLWMNLQRDFDLAQSAHVLASELARIVPHPRLRPTPPPGSR